MPLKNISSPSKKNYLENNRPGNYKMSSWIEALKKYNEKKGGKYVIPKKGTPEHAEVMALMANVKEAKPKKAEEAKPKKAEEAKPAIDTAPVPKISSLPIEMRRGMSDKLITTGMGESHQYKRGVGHPIDYILKSLSKLKGQETYWGKKYDTAVAFFNAVEKYIKSKAIDGNWDGEPQKYILESDWGKIFK